MKIISAISEELFKRQPAKYRESVLPDSAKFDLMVVTTGTKRMGQLQTQDLSLMNIRSYPTGMTNG